MDEFNYFTDDFLSNGGFQQLYSIVEYPEEISLWDSQSNIYSNDNIYNNNNRVIYNDLYDYNQNCDFLSDCSSSIYNSVNILTQQNEQLDINSSSSIASSSECFITDMDQWKLNHSNDLEQLNSVNDWDINLDNLLFDSDHSNNFDTTLSLDLPEKTFFCNDSCNSVLKESSEHLNSNLQNFLPHTKGPKSKLTKQNSDEKTFVCTFGECRKVYAKAGHLRAHLRRHIGDKPYVCLWPNCTWKFSRSDELSRHRRSHSGIKPYKCDYCPKCFSRSDHLTKHRKVHERKMAAMKIKAVWTSLPQGRPGRRPKVLVNQQNVDPMTMTEM